MLPKGLLKEYSQILTIILRLLDVFGVFFAGLIAFYFKFDDLNLPTHYIFALLIGSTVTLGVFHFNHIYESSRAKSLSTSIFKLVQSLLGVLILLASLAFFTKTGETFSREWFIRWSLYSFSVLVLFRLLLVAFLRLMRSKGWNERRVVVIGAGTLCKKLVETTQQSLWIGLRIVTIFDDRPKDEVKDINGIPVLKTPEDISAYLAVHRKEIDEIWIALPLGAERRVKEILYEMRHETVAIRFIVDIFGMDLLNHSIDEISGFPVLNIRTTPMVGVNRFIKSIEDRVLAALILMLISPLLLFIVFLVRLSSEGPIFYRQKRVGWNGEEFEMLKFRTMPVDAESKTGAVWATKNEARATSIGKWLRKTSLDELPQFINVLNGDMSIVGPRPERLIFVQKFKDQIPRYMQKHQVKAGITGWAQINGWRGDTSLEKRIEHDLYYIENWSLIFDLKIIFLTLFKGLIHKNAY